MDEVLGVLRDDPTKMPKNWNRRVKHNREKIKTGDVLEIADVVRNLALRDAEKGLSTGEKQMFSKVKHILASELMYAKHMREDDALTLPRRRAGRDLSPNLDIDGGRERSDGICDTDC